jgi:uncharacterized protein YecA (UPF0149 family)
MENFQQLLGSLDILTEDLTSEQIEGLKKFASSINDPNKLSANQAMKIVKDLKLDIEKLQKNARKIRSQINKPKRPKVGSNEPCPCNSGKKFKKCCIWKDDNSHSEPSSSS